MLILNVFVMFAFKSKQLESLYIKATAIVFKCNKNSKVLNLVFSCFKRI